MPRPRPISASSSHEEIFAQRYRWLMGWALRLTNLRVRPSRSVSIGHEKFAQLEGPNSCFDKKTTSCSTRKACKTMFSRTRVAALTIAHEEVGDGQEELLLLAA